MVFIDVDFIEKYDFLLDELPVIFLSFSCEQKETLSLI